MKWIRNKCLHSCGYNQVRGSAAGLSGIEKKQKQTHSSLCFQESAARTERLWMSSVQRVEERRGEAAWEEEGGAWIGWTSSFFFAGGSAFNYRWRMMLALFLSVMSCTCKPQNILESHHCPLIPPSPLSLSPHSSLHRLRAKLFIFTAVEAKMAARSFPLFPSLTPSKCWLFL